MSCMSCMLGRRAYFVWMARNDYNGWSLPDLAGAYVELQDMIGIANEDEKSWYNDTQYAVYSYADDVFGYEAFQESVIGVESLKSA